MHPSPEQQPEFDFDSKPNPNQEGYTRFQHEQEQRRRHWASKFGIPLGKKVSIHLKHLNAPLVGVIHLGSIPKGSSRPSFTVNRKTSNYEDIQSIATTD